MKLVFVYHIPPSAGAGAALRRGSVAVFWWEKKKKSKKKQSREPPAARKGDARHEYLMSFPAMTEFPSSRCAWSALGSDLFPLQPRRVKWIMEPEGIIEAIQRVYFSPIVFFPLKDSRGSTLFLFAVMYSKTGSLPRLMAFNAQGSNCCSWLLTSLRAHTNALTRARF